MFYPGGMLPAPRTSPPSHHPRRPLLPMTCRCLCYRFAARPLEMPLLSLCCLTVGNASAIALLPAQWQCLCYRIAARPLAMPLLSRCWPLVGHAFAIAFLPAHLQCLCYCFAASLTTKPRPRRHQPIAWWKWIKTIVTAVGFEPTPLRTGA